MRTTILTLLLLTSSAIFGPSTLQAQTTEPPLCKTTDGKHFASADQVRKCLKDSKTADRYAEAKTASAAAVANANAEAGRRVEVQAQLTAERGTSDERLVQVVKLGQRVAQLERRWKPWVVVVVGVVAFSAGGLAGGLAAKLAN